MAAPAEHIDPMASMFEQLAQRVAEIVLERIQPAMSQQAADVLPLDGLQPMKAYSPQEVAALLGTSRVESVYAIPENELPRIKRIGSRIGYFGINLLCYMHGLPPIDMEAVIESYRHRLMKDAPKVKPLSTEKPGLTKVL